MAYASGHPVRLIGGRLALDFSNTADWRADGAIAHEKLSSLEDLAVWLDAVGLRDAPPPTCLEAAIALRHAVRTAILGDEGGAARLLDVEMSALRLARDDDLVTAARAQPALSLIAVSAVAILSDARELSRVKTCGGVDCGWLFLDETKNARRKWCMMETCGNRAKAARNYSKRRPRRTLSDK